MQQLTTHEKTSFRTAPMFIRIGGDIEKRITAGEWKSDQQLPNETVLAAEYDVSQGTMRKALDALETKGLITRLQGKGTFVTDGHVRMEACRAKAAYLTAGNVSKAIVQERVAKALFDAGYSEEAAS